METTVTIKTPTQLTKEQIGQLHDKLAEALDWWFGPTEFEVSFEVRKEMPRHDQPSLIDEK